MNSKVNQPHHKPVLLAEVLNLLDPRRDETYLDATTGGGGHATEIAQIIGQKNLTLIDADPQVVANLKLKFRQATIYNNNFANQVLELQNQNIQFNMILADLGLSSLQLEDPDRGFSFLRDGPLDMRFNYNLGSSLQSLLNQSSASEIETILKKYAQERAAKQISLQIKLQKPQTTLELAQLVTEVKPKRFFKKHLHPATQTFMALRIWTNNEADQLASFLKTAPQLLKPAGRLAIISFHSLEDRLVKHAFKDLAAAGKYDCSYFIKNGKPIIPTINSLVSHPQARSAKLRVLQRY